MRLSCNQNIDSTAPKPLREPTVTQLPQLLTPQQGIADVLRLVIVCLRESDCRAFSPHRSSPKYCPLITIGASYPGFLSAILRLVYPDIVDAACEFRTTPHVRPAQ
jgi:hypothetical protein